MLNSLEEVEKYVYSVYEKNYDSYKEDLKCPLDAQTYSVDGARLQTLNSIFPFDLAKCCIGKSKIETAGNGVFAKQDINSG